MELREQAVLTPHVARHRPAGAGAHAPAHPVRQVRRAALPGGGARQGLHRAAAPGRQSGRRDLVVPGAAAAGGRRARRRRAGRSTCCGRGRRPAGGWPRAREQLPARARPARRRGRRAAATTSDDAGAGARAERLRDALAPLIEARYPDGALRLHDLEQLVAAARESGAELRHFVGELVLDPPQSSADLAGPPHLDEDYLVLSTVHSAKGLEWQAVHVLALYDGNFPADMAAGSEESIDEERRLLYVAMTRARRQLHLYVRCATTTGREPRRRARLRQAVALPDRRGAGAVRGGAARRRSRSAASAAGRPGASRSRSTHCSSRPTPAVADRLAITEPHSTGGPTWNSRRSATRSRTTC